LPESDGIFRIPWIKCESTPSSFQRMPCFLRKMRTLIAKRSHFLLYFCILPDGSGGMENLGILRTCTLIFKGFSWKREQESEGLTTPFFLQIQYSPWKISSLYSQRAQICSGTFFDFIFPHPFLHFNLFFCFLQELFEKIWSDSQKKRTQNFSGQIIAIRNLLFFRYAEDLKMYRKSGPSHTACRQRKRKGFRQLLHRKNSSGQFKKKTD